MLVTLAVAPTASAQLLIGTARDPAGDARTAGIGFAASKDLVQVDARYDRTIGDIVVDATMAGDVPSMGRHYYESFDVVLRSAGPLGCDGVHEVSIFGANSNDWGFWERRPAVADPVTKMSLTNGDTKVTRAGRRVTFRAGFGAVQGTGLRGLDLTCTTVEVRGPSEGGGAALFFGVTVPGQLYDQLDAPLRLAARKGTPEVAVKSRDARDRSAPFAFRATGSVILPASITKNATWCSGGVYLFLKRGTETVGETAAKLRPDCTYATTVRVGWDSRLPSRGTLRLGARFAGNDVLRARAAESVRVAYGPRPEKPVE